MILRAYSFCVGGQQFCPHWYFRSQRFEIARNEHFTPTRKELIELDELGAPRCGSGPPSPIVIGGPFPQAKPLPSPPSPSLFPPHPPWLFLQGSGSGRPRLVGGGGVPGRGGGGAPSGTWGQTHIWGYSNERLACQQEVLEEPGRYVSSALLQ